VEPGTDAAGIKPQAANGEKGDKGEIIVRFVSANDDSWHPPGRFPSLIQLNSAGQFSSESGWFFGDHRLPSLFSQTDAERRQRVVVHIILDITNQKTTSLPTLIRGIEKLKRAAPKETRAVIFVRYTYVPAK
jgi:hypothetical protein